MDRFSSKPIFDFIHAVTILPESPLPSQDALEEALEPALRYENRLRTHFVNNTLTDSYIGLINVFDTASRFRQSRPRALDDAEDLNTHHLFPLSHQSRRVDGSPSCVNDMAAFKKNWNLFTYGVLENFMTWDHVIVAGGSVVAALVHTDTHTDKELLEVYHSDAYASADVDMFLWGLSPSEVCIFIATLSIDNVDLQIG
jgi:hypothetical protein